MANYEFMVMLNNGQNTFTAKRGTDVFSSPDCRDWIFTRVHELGGCMIHTNVAKFFTEDSYNKFIRDLTELY